MEKTVRLDPRVIRTRRLLRDALMALITEKGYNAITVQDITERATLNRTTFYLHYRDKDDLLFQGMAEVLDELTNRHPLPVTENKRLSVEETWESILSDFEHIEQHAAFYRVMLGKQGVPEFNQRLREYVFAVTSRRLEHALGELPAGPVPTNLVLGYIASAYVGVIQWWLENDMPYTPAEIADHLVTLYVSGVYRALGLQADTAGASHR